MIDYKHIKLYLDKRICHAVFQRIYWLYEQQTTFGDEFVSCLNRYVNNWSRRVDIDIGIGKVNLLMITHINLNITPRPLQRAKLCLSNEV